MNIAVPVSVPTTLARRAAAPAGATSPAPLSQAEAQKLQAAKSALATLKSLATHRNDSAKTDAKQRIDRLKEQIRMLRMLGGSPKSLARSIAALAKELAAAVKEYAAAGGAEPEATEPSAEPAGSDTKAERAAEDATATPPDVKAAANADPYAKLKADLDKQSGVMAQQTAEAKERAEFELNVRSLAAQLKALAKQAKAAHAKSGGGELTDLANAGKALDEVDKTLHDMDAAAQKAMLSSGAVVNLSA